MTKPLHFPGSFQGQIIESLQTFKGKSKQEPRKIHKDVLC